MDGHSAVFEMKNFESIGGETIRSDIAVLAVFGVGGIAVNVPSFFTLVSPTKGAFNPDKRIAFPLYKLIRFSFARV